MASAERASTRAIDTDSVAVVLAATSVASVVIARGWVLWSAPGGDRNINQWVTTSPFDWPLALLIVLQGASVLEDRLEGRPRRTANAPTRVLAVTLAWLALSAAITPSWRALDFAFHVAGAWALVRTARRADRRGQTALLATLVGLGTLQALLGIAQSRTGDALGLGVLEFEGPLYTFGGSTAGRGSLTHPYHLTALLIVCAAAAAVLGCRVQGHARSASLAALGVMAVAMPLTFSRAVVLAIVPMLLLWSWRQSTRVLAAVMIAGLIVGGLLGTNGISAKSSRTVDVDQADSGRRQRVEEALNLVEEEPIFGVGPGRYVIALRDVDHDELLPPHNAVLHASAEAGVPGGVLTLATLVAFGLWVLRRRSPMVLAVAASLLPFHLLDSYPHLFPVGLLISGMWLAVLAIAVADGEVAGAP
jgi:O-antigen ligase